VSDSHKGKDGRYQNVHVGVSQLPLRVTSYNTSGQILSNCYTPPTPNIKQNIP